VIANAVAAALRPLGIEPRELPLSPPRLWALIAEAREGSDASKRAPVTKRPVAGEAPQQARGEPSSTR
jgi:hypothetical protein